MCACAFASDDVFGGPDGVIILFSSLFCTQSSGLT